MILGIIRIYNSANATKLCVEVQAAEQETNERKKANETGKGRVSQGMTSSPKLKHLDGCCL